MDETSPAAITIEDATAELYAQAPPGVRALHDAVVELTHAVSERIEVRPHRSVIGFARSLPPGSESAAGAGEFLTLAPGPAGSLRVGLNFPAGAPQEERLRANAAEFGADSEPTMTHWVALDADAVDADVIALEPLIEAAYDQHA